MIWFTADTHFYHHKVIEYDNRPFADVYEMNDALVSRWNERVMKGDLVYHLGDFSFGTDHEIDSILSRLNGQKYLLKGNHDRPACTKNNRWVWVKERHEIKVQMPWGKQLIVLSHYAHRVWRKSHHGSFHLHGHSHGNLDDIGGLILDVGVDCHNYAPTSLSDVFDYMSKRTISVCDHHKPEGLFQC